MARGRPDYDNPDFTNAGGNETPDQSFVALNGLTPLTSLGRVYLSDFFDYLLNGWELLNNASSLPPTIKLVTARSINRPWVCVLDPVVNAGDSILQKQVADFSDTRHGYEWFFVPEVNHCHIELTITHITQSGTKYIFRLAYDRVNGIWKYGTVNSGTTIYTPPTAAAYQQRNVRIKVVVDMTTGYFDKLFIGDYAINLTSFIANTVQADTNLGNTTVSFRALGGTGGMVEPIYITGFIWTLDEP